MDVEEETESADHNENDLNGSMKMKRIHTAIKRTEIATRHKAMKVGGIWVDPMNFPTLTE